MKPYQFMWGQKQSAMIAETHLLNFALLNDEFTLSKGVHDVIIEHDKGVLNIYFSEDSIEKSYENGKALLDKRKAKAIIKKIKTIHQECMKFLKRLRKIKHNMLYDQEILELIKEYRKHHILMQKSFRSSEPSNTKLVEEKIMKMLSKRFDENEVLEKLSILLTPTELDKTQKELIDWHELEKTDENLLKHALKYPANYANTWSYEEIIEYLRGRKEDPKEIDNIHKHKSRIKQEQRRIYEGDKELRHYCEIMQELALLRFELKHAWCGAETVCLDFLKHIAERIGIDFGIFIQAYNYSDLFRYFEENRKLTDKEIKDRMDYSVIHYKGNSITYLYGEEARKYFREFHEEKQEIKGNVAHKGKIKAKVRIVKVDDLKRFAEDVKQFQKGEVLVTTMTSPIMVPLASKSSAIITDEGGMLSHAAVIARELDVPCIVGTHDATKTFKDGDFVEIDVEKGIVRKI